MRLRMGSQLSRLGQLGVLADEVFAPELAERLRLLAFDPRKEADRVRRYEDAALRRMRQACDDFIQLRQSSMVEMEGSTARSRSARSEAASEPGWDLIFSNSSGEISMIDGQGTTCSS